MTDLSLQNLRKQAHDISHRAKSLLQKTEVILHDLRVLNQPPKRVKKRTRHGRRIVQHFR